MVKTGIVTVVSVWHLWQSSFMCSNRRLRDKKNHTLFFGLNIARVSMEDIKTGLLPHQGFHNFSTFFQDSSLTLYDNTVSLTGRFLSLGIILTISLFLGFNHMNVDFL